MQKISPMALGASLYLPATHKDIDAIACGGKISGLRSVILCFEDALSAQEIESGIGNLRALIARLAEQRQDRRRGPLLFVRPRHIEMAQRFAAMEHIGQIDGMVAPKFRNGQARAWVSAIKQTELMLMPILETSEMFDNAAVRELRAELEEEETRRRILALRIGGNDLLSCLGLRRVRGVTLYETPLVYPISMLIGMFVPAGFALTSPVYDIFDDSETLAAELQRDVQYGFVGKTVIHPCQIGVIEAAFRVDRQEYEAARRILPDDAAPVFGYGGAMHEQSTHQAWARRLIERAALYGFA